MRSRGAPERARCCGMFRRTLFMLASLAFLSQSDAWNLMHAPEMSLYRKMMRRLDGASNPFSRAEMTATVQHHDPLVLGNVNVQEKDAAVQRTPTSATLSEPVNGIANRKIRPNPSDRHDLVRQVVASSDGKLPTSKAALIPRIRKGPPLFEKLDAIYHAISHEETRDLHYVVDRDSMSPVLDATEEEKLVSVLRNSLDDAGFELLTRRDIDLCEALNAGYLLRLSIAPDVSRFDPNIAREFYPERFNQDGEPTQEFPFEGRVLLYRRGYSSEVTEGRLIPPKLDYLQASIVQRSARGVTQALGEVEKQLEASVSAISRRIKIIVRKSLASVANGIPNTAVSSFLRSKWGWKKVDSETVTQDEELKAEKRFFRLARYGGSKNRFMGSPNMEDALDPFLSYETFHGMNDAVNGLGTDDTQDKSSSDAFLCQYDAERYNPNNMTEQKHPSVLLERVSLNNVVDMASSEGRRTLVKRFFAKSQLVEPAYEEVRPNMCKSSAVMCA